MAETSLEPLDPYWPMVGDSCAKSGMETVGTASMVKTEVFAKKLKDTPVLCVCVCVCVCVCFESGDIFDIKECIKD